MEPIVYYIKGAWVLRMLQSVIGADAVEHLLRRFRLEHPFSTATTEEFTALAEEVSGVELDWFFEQWLGGTGVISLKSSSKSTDGEVEVTVTQKSGWSTEPVRFFRMPMTIRAGQGDRMVERSFELDGPESVFRLRMP